MGEAALEARRLAPEAVVVVALAGLLSFGCGGHQPRVSHAKSPPRASRPAAPPRASRPAAALKGCLDHWNSPGNPTQRIRFATAAREAAAGTPVDDKALVLVYRGPPIGDVGVGVGGVNLAPGDCMVVHPAAVMFAFTDGFWHQVGDAPGEPALSALPVQAAKSPNASVDLTSGTVMLNGGT